MQFRLPIIIISLILFLISSVVHAQIIYELNTDRHGSDYQNFVPDQASPVSCMQACYADSRCKAWTYVKPGFQQGSRPHCWLKNKVPNPKYKPCCESGVKWELNTDRHGSDYQNFVPEQADPDGCYKACYADSRCMAWTYVKPNTTQGSEPRCWLKNSIPNPTYKTWCISGVTRKPEYSNLSPKCTQKPYEPNCGAKANFTYYYYDSTSRQCESYQFGGCSNGAVIPFETYEECAATCLNK